MLNFIKVKISNANQLIISKSIINKSTFIISGTNNTAILGGEHLSNCNISITGNNNMILVGKKTGITNGILTISGNNCIIKIGANSTFGGVRILNFGSNNSVDIGENCMFSDNIEIWASDIPTIYNKEGEKINKDQVVIIKDKVWVGSHVKIQKGVVIGEGAIIGMASVVENNIDPFSINVGNPTKCLKQNVTWSKEY